MKKKPICHPGQISKIEGNTISVRIVSTSACASCHAKGACTASDMEDKIIEAIDFHPEKYIIGQKVNVVMKKSLGMKAVAYGYFIPFLLVLSTLIISQQNLNNELYSGLLSLGIVIPYYIILFIFRNKISNTFRFHIEVI